MLERYKVTKTEDTAQYRREIVLPSLLKDKLKTCISNKVIKWWEMYFCFHDFYFRNQVEMVISFVSLKNSRAWCHCILVYIPVMKGLFWVFVFWHYKLKLYTINYFFK